jgi:hypothetical protein
LRECDQRAGVEELLEEAGIRKISPAVRLRFPLALCRLDVNECSFILVQDNVLLFPATTDLLLKTKRTRVLRLPEPESAA